MIKCGNGYFDVLWRHMTSRRLMVSKTCKMEFENMTMSDIKFELHRISRKEMANEWTHVLKTALWRHSDVTMTSWWLFWVFRWFLTFSIFLWILGKKSPFLWILWRGEIQCRQKIALTWMVDFFEKLMSALRFLFDSE